MTQPEIDYAALKDAMRFPDWQTRTSKVDLVLAQVSAFIAADRAGYEWGVREAATMVSGVQEAKLLGMTVPSIRQQLVYDILKLLDAPHDPA